MSIFFERLRGAPVDRGTGASETGLRHGHRRGLWMVPVAAVFAIGGLLALRTSPPPRDYLEEIPVGPLQYEAFARLYDYDSALLDASVESTDTTDSWILERVSFTAAYDSERMAAYVYLPRRARPPFQAVVCWPGSLVLWTDTLDSRLFGDAFDFFLTAGRAFVLPAFKGTFDRDDYMNPVQGQPSWPNQVRDQRIQWVQDLRRTLDYLESRVDMDTAKLAFYGWSWGAFMLPIALAVEPRFKVGISDEGGMTGMRPPPEVDPFHFLSRVAVPVLMLNGRNSQILPYEEAQLPMFELLGTPPKHKRHILYDAEHVLENSMIAADMLEWLDDYLGPVEGP